MELRHLRYFVAVAEEEHMTRAAAQLGIQQPPLSQQIRDLERELGVELFDRTPRSIKLNATGSVFLDDARALLALADEAKIRARQTARGELGHIVVGYTSSASLHEYVPQIIRAFRARYPLIRLDVRENTTRDLLDAVADKKIDVAFVRSSTLHRPELLNILLCEEPMVVAMPVDHPLASGSTPLSLGTLANESFVLYLRGDGPGIQDVLIPACRKAGFTPHIVESVSRLLSAVTMVAAGRGISIVPEVLQSVHQSSVAYRALDAQSSFSVPLSLVCPLVREDSPVGRFVAIAKSLRSGDAASKRRTDCIG
ncbi:LysR substrate-binding domain-containing protein [Paraburkholderia sp.]|uniref:LysR substrate-binding domain-containing protein n=1 Tax=Paraburkholderia sp. TaxID=1926495 RepID=UPI0039E60DE8